jgi:hypothetical protein
MCLHVTALRDTMALRVNTSTRVHDLHASTILRAQTLRVLSTSAFVNQDIQVRSLLKSWLRMIIDGGRQKITHIDFHYFNTFPCIITMTKPRRVRRLGHAVPLEEKQNAQRVLAEN